LQTLSSMCRSEHPVKEAFTNRGKFGKGGGLFAHTLGRRAALPSTALIRPRLLRYLGGDLVGDLIALVADVVAADRPVDD
jgi:hypothetical protein